MRLKNENKSFQFFHSAAAAMHSAKLQAFRKNGWKDGVRVSIEMKLFSRGKYARLI
jgi:hypothetical protein